MTLVKSAALSIVSTLEDEHGEALERATALSETLTRLRYEGKTSFGHNIKAARRVADYFSKKILRHMTFEEKTIFPFLKTHIPKLEPVIHLLTEEHDDFRKKLGQFRLTLKKQPLRAETTTSWKWIDDLTESGTYLVCLLRQHAEAEKKSLYKAIQGELREGERHELRARMRDQWKKEGMAHA